MINKSKPIHAYEYTGYATLKILQRNLRFFNTLEEGLDALEKVRARGFYTYKQIVFIDFGVAPSRIIHIVEPVKIVTHD
jgi:hypothetical protein